MDINEDELRAMVRTAIARQSGGGERQVLSSTADARHHASHGLLSLVGGGDSEGQCLIESSVRCNHCNFCQSLGH
jgi:hypothetical protein